MSTLVLDHGRAFKLAARAGFTFVNAFNRHITEAIARASQDRPSDYAYPHPSHPEEKWIAWGIAAFFAYIHDAFASEQLTASGASQPDVLRYAQLCTRGAMRDNGIGAKDTVALTRAFHDYAAAPSHGVSTAEAFEALAQSVWSAL